MLIINSYNETYKLDNTESVEMILLEVLIIKKKLKQLKAKEKLRNLSTVSNIVDKYGGESTKCRKAV